jgi:non-lysosomal glucosylceramidase
LLCSWPHGGRPRIPFVYSDEVWTGIEYQVATHLIYEGLVEQGRSVVRAVRERHDGRRRNPWNEVECGNHYARSLASWGPLLALSGVDYDAPSATMTIRPRLDAPVVRSIFTTGTGWGEFVIDEAGARLTVHAGSLALATLTIDHPASGRFQATDLTIDAGETLGIPAIPIPPEEQ